MGTEWDELGTLYLEAKAKFRHSAFSQEESSTAIGDEGRDGGEVNTKDRLDKVLPRLER